MARRRGRRSARSGLRRELSRNNNKRQEKVDAANAKLAAEKQTADKQAADSKVQEHGGLIAPGRRSMFNQQALTSGQSNSSSSEDEVEEDEGTKNALSALDTFREALGDGTNMNDKLRPQDIRI